MEIRRLEIGAGPYDTKREGYEHNDLNPGPDIEIVGAIQELDFPENTWDEIFGSGVIEHLTYFEAAEFFRRAIKWLKPGGFVDFNVPDCARWMERVVKQNYFQHHTIAIFEGWCRFPGDEHKSWWSKEMLDITLTAAGFVDLDLYSLCAYGGEENWHLCYKAYKPIGEDSA